MFGLFPTYIAASESTTGSGRVPEHTCNHDGRRRHTGLSRRRRSELRTPANVRLVRLGDRHVLRRHCARLLRRLPQSPVWHDTRRRPQLHDLLRGVRGAHVLRFPHRHTVPLQRGLPTLFSRYGLIIIIIIIIIIRQNLYGAFYKQSSAKGASQLKIEKNK